MLLLIIAYLLGLLSATAEAQRLIPIDGLLSIDRLMSMNGWTEFDKLDGAPVAAPHGDSGGE